MKLPACLDGTRVVFVDCEFTGEHALTTLVSVGLVTLTGHELYVTLNDYDRSQVTDWLRENVLAAIDGTQSVSSAEAFRRIKQFLDGYTNGSPLYVVSAGLCQDVILLLELFKHGSQSAAYFHALHDTPDYLRHYAFIDLNTLFRTAGIAPMSRREEFAGVTAHGRRHNALDDARVVRACFLKLMASPAGEALARTLDRAA
jgi:DNA polymerase III epsilon subunit-like protein